MIRRMHLAPGSCQEGHTVAGRLRQQGKLVAGCAPTHEVRTQTSRFIRQIPVSCPRCMPHQPHQSTTVDVISCHEPCHAASDRCGSSLLVAAPAGSRIAHEFGQRFRDGDGLGPGLAVVRSDQNGDLSWPIVLAPEPWKSMNPSPSVPSDSATIWCPIHDG
jgi:hypothetical protein